MNNIKFGLIGCGRISAKHFEAIAQIENAEIISCCDIIEKKAKETSEKHNIKTVARLGETPILLNPLASNFIIGLNIYLNLYFDGINKI